MSSQKTGGFKLVFENERMRTDNFSSLSRSIRGSKNRAVCVIANTLEKSVQASSESALKGAGEVRPTFTVIKGA